MPDEPRLAGLRETIRQRNRVLGQEVWHCGLHRSGQFAAGDDFLGGFRPRQHLVLEAPLGQILPILRVSEATAPVSGELLSLEADTAGQRRLVRAAPGFARACAQVLLAGVATPVARRPQSARQQFRAVAQLMHR